MYILSIEIFGNTRFKLANIKHLKVDFHNLIQILIGTNGSGKTALLNELSALPSASSDYIAGGFKQIIISHRNAIYKARSQYHPTHHSFMVDNQELNVSGKETEQRKLVKEHFGLTPSLFKLLIGEIKFSALSSQARRDWLMSISQMNFDYAMRLFQKAKDVHKEALVLTNNMAEREVGETEKLKQIGDVSILREEATALKTKLNRLMRMTTTDTKVDAERFRREINQYLQSLEVASKGYMRHLQIDHPSLAEYASLTDFMEFNQQLEGQIKANSYKLKELYRKKENLTELAARAVDEGVTLSEARAEIQSLEQQLQAASVSQFPYFFYDLNLDRAEVEYYRDRILEAIHAYISNVDLKFNSDYIQALGNRLQAHEQTLLALDKEHHRLEHAMRHYQEQPMAECPECQHHFKINDAEKHLAEVNEALQLVNVQKDATKAELSQSEEERAKMYEFIEARRTLHAQFNGATNPVYQKLKERITEVEKQGTNSRGLQAVLDEWMEVVIASYRYKDIKLNLEEKKHLLVHLEDLDRLKREYEGLQLSDVDVEIESLYQQVMQHKATHEQNGYAIAAIQRVLKGVPEIDGWLNEVARLSKCYEEALLNNLLNDAISELQSELAIIESKISKVDSIQHTIANLQNYRAEASAKEKYGKMLMECLSPNKGLIAEHVMSFLNDFIDNLNSLVGEVWEYDMEIFPCKLDGVEVDYRFPVRLAGDVKHRKDISETSKGQLSFINLAFRLAIISTLKDTVFPLYLDEEGEGLDEQHTENLVRFIKNYAEAGAAEQIFIISHDFAGHASFQHAETLVLCTKNVKNIPARYNQHASIVYN